MSVTLVYRAESIATETKVTVCLCDESKSIWVQILVRFEFAKLRSRGKKKGKVLKKALKRNTVKLHRRLGSSYAKDFLFLRRLKLALQREQKLQSHGSRPAMVHCSHCLKVTRCCSANMCWEGKWLLIIACKRIFSIAVLSLVCVLMICGVICICLNTWMHSMWDERRPPLRSITRHGVVGTGLPTANISEYETYSTKPFVRTRVNRRYQLVLATFVCKPFLFFVFLRLTWYL